jgi:hypothetical protein
MTEEHEAMEILRQVEAGEIDAETAAGLLERDPEPQDEPQASDIPNRWSGWWLIPFSITLIVIAAGIGLGQLGGWWWLLAGPLLVTGGVVLTLLIASIGSPWVHIRVHTGQDSWPRRIAISLPLPLRVSVWGLRMFGVHIPGLENTSLDELLLALEEGLSGGEPIQIDIDEGESGERVQVYLG